MLSRHGAGEGWLLVNTQSSRAALQTSAPSRMFDDGGIEERVRLIRPMGRESLSLDDLRRSHWQELDEARFVTAWEDEVATVPAVTTSAFHVITGLLLPIWDRLPEENARVYRLQTDDGERVIGRLVAPEALDAVYAALGVGGTEALSASEAWDAVLNRGASLQLAGGLGLRRSRVMGSNRCEVTGFSDGAVDQLKAMGCIGEIISWRLRLFIPEREDASRIVTQLLAQHPIVKCLLPR